MKKPFFLPLVVAVALTAGCPDPASNNAPGGGNAAKNASDGNRVSTQDVNVNANVNADQTVSPVAANKEDKTVVVVVFDDASGKRMILAAPDKLQLRAARNERLDFIVVNNLDDVLTNLKIEFTGSNGNPMEGVDLDFSNIPAGGSQQGRTGKIRDTATAGSYKYAVSTNVAAGPSPTPLDPEIIINRDR
ncbi:MAG TPA: hypothetical protein VER32_13090 [Pyrinomonadaceae bacterium]|nr:hypothetical protein [Pyrinomonadaceae bacterium]